MQVKVLTGSEGTLIPPRGGFPTTPAQGAVRARHDPGLWGEPRLHNLVLLCAVSMMSRRLQTCGAKGSLKRHPGMRCSAHQEATTPQCFDPRHSYLLSKRTNTRDVRNTPAGKQKQTKMGGSCRGESPKVVSFKAQCPHSYL